MTKIEFMALCGEYLIEPCLALEDEKICEALLQRNDKEVRRILEEES